MTNKKLTKIIGLGGMTLALAGILITVPAYTQSESAQQGQQGDSSQQQGNSSTSESQGSQNGAINGCQNVEAKIQERVSNNFQVKNAYSEKYQQIQDKVEAVVQYAKNNDGDTTNLEAALEQLKTRVQAFNQVANQYQEQLQTTQQYTCGKSEGEFKGSLLQSRIKLQETRLSAYQVKQSVQTQVIPALEELKEELQGE